MQQIMQKTLSFLSLSLVLAACNNPTSTSTATPTPSPVSAEVEQIESASNQIAAAFTSGASLKCMVTKEGQPNSQYFVKDKKMKMVSEATTDNPDQLFSINDGEYVYMWSSDTSKPGMKMSLEEIKNASESFDNQFQQFPDISDQSVRDDIENSGFQMNCAPEQVDDSEFIPPTDVTFNNPMEMFKGMMENVPSQQ